VRKSTWSSLAIIVVQKGGNTMSHIIIGIHGLSNKPAADVLEAGWKKSILEGLNKNEGIDNVSLNFSSVYWANKMYAEIDPAPDLYRVAADGALKTYNESWLDAVREKAFDWAGDLLDEMKNHFGMDAIADGVLKAKLKDLSRYYEDDNKKKELRGLLRDEIIKNKEKRIMILSHSMGTIISYDVLRDLGKEFPRIIVDHFVTLGSPLGIPHVKYKIASENPLVRTPSIVKKWSNFADKRDPVAMDVSLAGDYDMNDGGVRVEDDLVANDWGGIHHKSYGYLRAPEVSRVIRSFI
jgi:hypothetical protein